MNAGKSKVMVLKQWWMTDLIVQHLSKMAMWCPDGKGDRVSLCSCAQYVQNVIHKRCSGVRGDLSRVADGFRCRRCDGTIRGS